MIAYRIEREKTFLGRDGKILWGCDSVSATIGLDREARVIQSPYRGPMGNTNTQSNESRMIYKEGCIVCFLILYVCYVNFPTWTISHTYHNGKSFG